jgi:hypothetical protein
MIKVNVFVTLLTALHFFAPTIAASECIGNFTVLQTLDNARVGNTTTPVTYVICPNTVFNFTLGGFWDLKGNTSYLCGADGASTNNCLVTGGGGLQFIIGFDGSSNKGDILVSGFTFTKSELTNGVIANPGKSTFRDCIFKVSQYRNITNTAFTTSYSGLTTICILCRVNAYPLPCLVQRELRRTVITFCSAPYNTSTPWKFDS